MSGLKMNITGRFSRLFTRNRPVRPVNRTPSLNRSPSRSFLNRTIKRTSSLDQSPLSSRSLNRKSNNLFFKSIDPILILGALPTDFGKMPYNGESKEHKISRSIRSSNVYYLNKDDANSRNNFPYVAKISNAERSKYFQVNLTQRGNFIKLHEYHDFFKTIVFDLGVWHHLFHPLNNEYQEASPQMDLIANLLKKGGKIYLYQTPKYKMSRFGNRLGINEDKTNEYYKDIMDRFEEAGLSVEKDVICKEIEPIFEMKGIKNIKFIVGEKI